MKRDIRKLFKEDEVVNKLPKNHRQEFEEKLSELHSDKKENYSLLKIAVSIVLLFSIGIYVLNQDYKPKEKESALCVELRKIEKEYLKDIDIEWQSFLQLTEDPKLINKYKEKLKLLDEDYQRLSNLFKKQTNDIEVLEGIIENLQQRLFTLKEIKEHLKILKETPKTYETIIL